ncbi:MAG TPA: hemolysin family protein, partial [Candidatus Acidoferrum sp.]|nr:hemolysin family protein [Candidatus Acidoferrum sp.]
HEPPHARTSWSFHFSCVAPSEITSPVDFTPYLVLAGVLVCAGASFFFAVAESALFALGKWQVDQLDEKVPLHGSIVVRLLQQPSELLATIVLGNSLANASIVAIGLGTALWRGGSTPLALTGLFILILIGCEVLPKTLAVRDPEKWSLRVARPMLLLQRASRPLQRFVQWLNTLLLHGVLARAMKPQPMTSEEDYRELLDLAVQQGALAARETEIIAQIIGLDQKAAADVMTARSKMACIPDDLTVEQMIAEARRLRHRRLPLYDESPDTIVGVLDTKLLLLDPRIDLAEAIEFPSFVPESMNLLKLFVALQRQQRGIAIVMDEFGGTAGVVTMEDILEEVIGEIRGEGERPGFIMEKLADYHWRVSGAMNVADFRREYPELGDVDVETMGGLLVSLLEVVPGAGDSVLFRGLKLTAHTVEERTVRELIVERAKK